jgi:hypothetical protein
MTWKAIFGMRDILRQRAEEPEWRNVRTDVAPFLERAEELELLTQENMLRISR